MSYEPTVWETGDVVTAEKMNKLELGVVNSCNVLVCTISDVAPAKNVKGDTPTIRQLDVSFSQIRPYLGNGVVIAQYNTGAHGVLVYNLMVYQEDDEGYAVMLGGLNDTIAFYAETDTEPLVEDL